MAEDNEDIAEVKDQIQVFLKVRDISSQEIKNISEKHRLKM